MGDLCRVYFREQATLRAFYWFELAEDQSIYFGTSNTKDFKTGRAGVETADLGGKRIFPEVEGRPMSPTELKNKNSIHGSGVVNLPTQTSIGRDRYEIAPPRDGFDSLPLVGILPMNPVRYPVSHKTPKQTDIVISSTMHSPDSYGLLFYLKVPGLPESPPVVAAKRRIAAFAEESVLLGRFLLCSAIYADPTHMPGWQPQEVEVLAHPSLAGEQPNWPFFA